MKYVYDPNHKELNRYVIIANINNCICYFKRYGTDPEKIKREFIVFVHEAYDVFIDSEIVIKEDPSHPVDYNA